MMFNDEELTSVSEDLDWTLEDFKLGGTIAALGAIKVDNDKVNLISRPNTCLCRIFSMRDSGCYSSLGTETSSESGCHEEREEAEETGERGRVTNSISNE